MRLFTCTLVHWSILVKSLLCCSVSTVIEASEVLARLEVASAIPDACGDLLFATSHAGLCPAVCSDGVLIVLELFLSGQHYIVLYGSRCVL